MEVHGLPLHALAVHGAVVFGPLSALTGLAYALPRYRDRLRWPLVVMTVIAFVAIWVALISGRSVLHHNEFFRTGPSAALVRTHQNRAHVLAVSVTAFAAVSLLAAWLHHRSGAVRAVLTGLVVVGAVVTMVWTVLTGDAGARIAWNGIKG